MSVGGFVVCGVVWRACRCRAVTVAEPDASFTTTPDVAEEPEHRA